MATRGSNFLVLTLIAISLCRPGFERDKTDWLMGSRWKGWLWMKLTSDNKLWQMVLLDDIALTLPLRVTEHVNCINSCFIEGNRSWISKENHRILEYAELERAIRLLSPTPYSMQDTPRITSWVFDWRKIKQSVRNKWGVFMEQEVHITSLNRHGKGTQKGKTNPIVLLQNILQIAVVIQGSFYLLASLYCK